MTINNYKLRYKQKFAIYYRDYLNNVLLRYFSANNSKNTKILDVGCGNGAFYNEWVKLESQVIGLDISFYLLKQINLKKKNILSLQGNGICLPIKCNSIDYVISRGFFHHLSKENCHKFLLELHRVIKQNGKIIFIEPNKTSILLQIIRKIYFKFSSHYNEDHRSFSKKQLYKLFNNYDFKVLNINYSCFFAFGFCALNDHFPILNYLPFSIFITRILIQLDKLLEKIPIIKTQSWQLIGSVQKKIEYR